MNDAPAPTRKLSLSTKISYGIGSAPGSIKSFAFGVLLLFYYNQVLGVSGTLCGWALGIAVCFDAISDPMVGSISDNFRSKLGRRHPFMYASAIPLGLCFYFLFSPPNAFTEIQLFLWLVTFAILVRLSLTFYYVPSAALMAEFSPDYYERTQIVSYRIIIGYISAICIGLFTLRFLFPTTPEYTPGHLNPAGYPVFATIASCLMVCGVLFTTHFTRKEIPFLPKPPQEKKPFGLMNVFREVMLALRNRNFRLVFIVMFCFGAIGGTGGALYMYMYTYFWGLLPEQMAWLSLASLGAVISFIIIKPIQKRFEKKIIGIVCFCSAILTGVTMVNLRFLDILPENGDPLLLKLLIAERIFDYCAMTLCSMVFPSLMADIVDEHELETNYRQEGIFYSALTFSSKSISGLGVIFGGMIIDFLAFPKGADPTTLDPQIITNLGITAGIVLPLCYLLPTGLCLLIDMNKEKHEAIQAELTIRRAQQEMA